MPGQCEDLQPRGRVQDCKSVIRAGDGQPPAVRVKRHIH